jgi:hypothetical protein
LQYNRKLLGLAASAMLVIATSAQATLLERDLDRNGITDAFYDSTLNITWLRNANANGEMSWQQATSWVSNFEFGGYTDWRLPEVATPCTGYSCFGSEMGHLWYDDLGNTPGSFKPGGFSGMVQGGYWTGSEVQGRDSWGNDLDWQFLTNGGYQRIYYGFALNNAMAVRDGDMMRTVPEPATYAMLLAGLGMMSCIARRRKLKNTAA